MEADKEVTLSPGEMGQVVEALLFATKAHEGQKRSSGAPYMLHPIRVMNILMTEVALPADMRPVLWKMMQAALLHDVVEDCEVKVHELTALFGGFVSGVVLELTQDPNEPKDVRRKRMLEHCGSMSRHAQVIKLCDRLDNMREMSDMSKKFVARYCSEARIMLDEMHGACPEVEAKIRELIEKNAAPTDH